MLFYRLLIFFNINFSKNYLRNSIRVSNSLDPDQAQHFVGPDLGPNCLQRLSADNTIRQKAKHNHYKIVKSPKCIDENSYKRSHNKLFCFSPQAFVSE